MPSAIEDKDQEKFIIREKVKKRSAAKDEYKELKLSKLLPFDSQSIPCFLNGLLTIDPKRLDLTDGSGKFFTLDSSMLADKSVTYYLFIPKNTLTKQDNDFCRTYNLFNRLKDKPALVSPENNGYVFVRQRGQIQPIPGQIKLKDSKPFTAGNYAIKFRFGQRYEVYCYVVKSDNSRSNSYLIIPCAIRDFDSKSGIFATSITAELEQTDLAELRNYETIEQEMIKAEKSVSATAELSKKKGKPIVKAIKDTIEEERSHSPSIS